jgi:hypothetical protein
LENAAGTDIFFIPEVPFPKETPGLEDDEGCGIRYDRSYGAESVENVESAKTERGSREMSGKESSLPFARGVA